MNDFDTRLRERLERLEAAVPAPDLPSLAPRRASGPQRRRQVVILLAATIALLLATAVATTSAPVPRTPAEQAAQESAAAAQQAAKVAMEDRVNAALGPLMPDDECVSQAEAMRRLRTGLDEMGLRDWGITTGSGSLEGARCVTFGAAADTKVIVLIGALDLDERDGTPLASALQGVADELMSRCLGAIEARRLLASVLTALGVEDWRFGDDGRLMAPVGREQAVLDHVANGCSVYSGAARDADGRTVYYITGR